MPSLEMFLFVQIFDLFHDEFVCSFVSFEHEVCKRLPIIISKVLLTFFRLFNRSERSNILLLIVIKLFLDLIEFFLAAFQHIVLFLKFFGR